MTQPTEISRNELKETLAQMLDKAPTEISPEARECAKSNLPGRSFYSSEAEYDLDITSLAAAFQNYGDKAKAPLVAELADAMELDDQRRDRIRQLQEENTRLKESLANVEKKHSKVVQERNLEFRLRCELDEENQVLKECIRVKDEALRKCDDWMNHYLAATHMNQLPACQPVRCAIEEALSHNTGRKEI